jgi:hypothetical protein
MESNAQYAYAYDGSRNLVFVNSLKRSSAGSEVYICLGCGKPLIPVLGEKRIKHFRHKTDDNCSLETYLHLLGKEYFRQEYTRCLNDQRPFNITLNETWTCTHYEAVVGYSCDLEIPAEYDLTRHFTDVYLEQRDGQFIPDLLLTNARNDKLYVEIYVTHESSIEKRESGFRIIEIHLSTEADLEVIRSCNLTDDYDSVSFYNFNTSKTGKPCKGNCQTKYPVFIVWGTGRCLLSKKKLGEIANIKQNGNLAYLRIIKEYDYTDSLIFTREAILAYKEKAPIKNCLLCSYYRTFGTEANFCSFLRKNGNSNEAANCEHYLPDESKFPKL